MKPSDLVPQSFLRSRNFAAFCIVAAGVMLSIVSCTDYIYYYLPLSDYLYKFGGFPPHLSLSAHDFILAYPPAESLLLYPVHWFPNFPGFAVKFIHVAKLFTVFYLMHLCLARVRNRRVYGLMLVQPGLIIYMFLYNTDLSALIAMMAVVLYYEDRRYAALAVAAVSYALLSKYIFCPFYVWMLAYLFFKKRARFYVLLLPLIPFGLFLYKNYALYGNPVFPMAARLFQEIDPVEWDILVKNNFINIVTQWNMAQVEIVFVQLAVGMIFPAFLLPWKKDKWLAFLFVTYLIFFALVPFTSQGKDTGRYLFQLTWLVLYLLSVEDVDETSVMVVIAAGLALALPFIADWQAKALGAIALTYPLCCLLPRLRPFAVVSALLLISSYAGARAYTKFNVDPKELGYGIYEEHIAALRDITSRGEKVLTNFAFMPMELRMNQNLVLFYSTLNNEDIRNIALKKEIGDVRYMLLNEWGEIVFRNLIEAGPFVHVKDVQSSGTMKPFVYHLYSKTDAVAGGSINSPALE